MSQIFRDRRSWFGCFMIVAVAGILFCPLLPAQENLGKGRVNGTVADENGALMEGVLIVAEIQGGKTKLDGKSDKKGRFAIAGLGTSRPP
jgi:hypothetical protein